MTFTWQAVPSFFVALHVGITYHLKFHKVIIKWEVRVLNPIPFAYRLQMRFATLEGDRAPSLPSTALEIGSSRNTGSQFHRRLCSSLRHDTPRYYHVSLVKGFCPVPVRVYAHFGHGFRTSQNTSVAHGQNPIRHR